MYIHKVQIKANISPQEFLPLRKCRSAALAPRPLFCAEEGVLSASTSDRRSDGGSTQSSDLQEIERGCPYPEEMADDSFIATTKTIKLSEKMPKHSHEKNKGSFSIQSGERKELNIREILDSVSSLFDKSELIKCQSLAELLDAHHIECSEKRRKRGKENLDLEDKGDLKETLKTLESNRSISRRCISSYRPKMELSMANVLRIEHCLTIRKIRSKSSKTMRQIEDDSKTSFIIKQRISHGLRV